MQTRTHNNRPQRAWNAPEYGAYRINFQGDYTAQQMVHYEPERGDRLRLDGTDYTVDEAEFTVKRYDAKLQMNIAYYRVQVSKAPEGTQYQKRAHFKPVEHAPK